MALTSLILLVSVRAGRVASLLTAWEPLSLNQGYLQGSTTGFVRFRSADEAVAAVNKTDDGKLALCDCTATVKRLEGQDEQEFFQKVHLTHSVYFASYGC